MIFSYRQVGIDEYSVTRLDHSWDIGFVSKMDGFWRFRTLKGKYTNRKCRTRSGAASHLWSRLRAKLIRNEKRREQKWPTP